MAVCMYWRVCVCVCVSTRVVRGKDAICDGPGTRYMDFTKYISASTRSTSSSMFVSIQRRLHLPEYQTTSPDIGHQARAGGPSLPCKY